MLNREDRHHTTLRAFGLTKSRGLIIVAISLTAAFFEGFGMAMFLPLLEYIEKGQNISALPANSRLWKVVLAVFSSINVRVSLLSLLAAILVLLLARIAFMYARQVYSAWLAQDVLHQTRSNLLAAYLRSEYGSFDRQSTGRIINLITTETGRVGGAFSSLFALFANGLVIAGYVLVLFWLSTLMTLLAVIFLALSGLVVNYYVRHTKRISRLTTDSNEELSFLIVERLTGLRLMKLTATVEREIRRLYEASQKVGGFNFISTKLNARVDLLLEPIVVFSGMMILFAAVNYFKMGLSQVGLFMLVLLRLLPLCKEFLRSRQSFLACTGSFEAVREGFREARANREENGGERTFIHLHEGIRLENVTFSYPGKTIPALDQVDLFIPAGKMTALIGPSGAGKSTLVDLLPRLRVPRQGHILLDGHPLETYALDSVRRGIAFVSQDTFIFNDTVRANIAFPRPEATDEEIWQVLEKTKSGEFVKSLPNGLNTVLGERGMRLSGGQRQRLSLARGLLQKAPILILDEPTSALDSEVERDIQEVIDGMRSEGNVTIIVIAHRMSTVRKADKIVVLQDGRVVEEGSHDQLLSSRNWYALVSELQAYEAAAG